MTQTTKQTNQINTKNTYKKITVTLTPAELELIASGLTKTACEHYARIDEIENDFAILADELTPIYTVELDAINDLNFKLGTESETARKIRSKQIANA